ncbi:MAG: sterol desaturase family protein [Deltaproteobacteria bacterium]|nr:sterol desaturase family protein [Deltaproteobacteria bacterium]
MASNDLFMCGAGFLVAVGGATYIEWAAHWLMHNTSWFFAEVHEGHHKGGGRGQGVLGEAWDYFLPTLPLGLLGFIVSIPFGVGTTLGTSLFAFVAGYSHQLQHERPELCFWLRRPIHYIHHLHDQRSANFGILLDVWDRILGTYDAMGWEPDPQLDRSRFGLRDYLSIGWRRGGGIIEPATVATDNAAGVRE